MSFLLLYGMGLVYLLIFKVEWSVLQFGLALMAGVNEHNLAAKGPLYLLLVLYVLLCRSI